MIHSGLPFFNPLLGVGGVAFPWTLQTQTSPPSSPPPSPVGGTRVSSFTIDAILGRRHHQHHDSDSGNVARSLARRREERLARTAPYTPSSISGSHPSIRDHSSGVPTTGGGNGGGSGSCTKAKAKRVRTIFTAEQLERLEAEFARQQYMVGPERLYLAAALQLTEAQVKVWFQNRRIKWRKAFMEQQHARLSHSPDETTETISLPSSPLRQQEESSSEELLHHTDMLTEERLLDTTSSIPSANSSSEPLQQVLNTHILSAKLSPNTDLSQQHISDVTNLSCTQ